MSITIAAINQSTIVSDSELDLVCAALTGQSKDLLASGWNDARNAKVNRYRRTPPSEAWPMYVVDDHPEAGDALGWHEATPNGDPIIYVLAGVAKRYGLSWSVTASHEFCETVVDQGANEVIDIGGVFLANEACDAVEADEYGYTKQVADPVSGRRLNVLVSDFITRDWFLPDATGPFDFTGQCPSPVTLLPGGYIGVWRNGKWTQAVADRPSPGGRSRVEFSTRTPRKRAGEADWTGVPWVAVPAGVPLTSDVVLSAPVMEPWGRAA
jgi:hypothetical protein